MVTKARSRPYKRSHCEHVGLRVTTPAELAANPIVDPLTDLRVHTAAQIAEAFDRCYGRTLRIGEGKRLCMRERLDVPYDGALLCLGDGAVVGVFDADQNAFGIRVGEPGILYGVDPTYGGQPRHSRLRFERYTQSDWNDATADIGIQIWNAYRARIDVIGARESACPLEIATDVSTAYSQFGIGYILNGQVGIRLKNYGASAWTNNNTFKALHGGRIACDSGVNLSLSRYGVLFTRDDPADSELMDGNEFVNLTLELNGNGLSVGAESVCFVHEIGVRHTLKGYWDEGNSQLARWSGNTREHAYIPRRNDLRQQRVEYLGVHGGARTQRRDRNGADVGSYRWRSPDWSQSGNHVISQATNPNDTLWVREACQINSSNGNLQATSVASSSGFSVANGYLKSASTSRAWGVLLNTRQGKEFFLNRESDRTVNNGGRFLIRPFDINGVVLGGRAVVSGAFTAVADSGGFAQFTHAAHAVQVDDVLEITGASNAGYNLDRSAQAITSIANTGGQQVLTTPAPHDLLPGDWIWVYGCSNVSHFGPVRVYSTPSTTTAVLDMTPAGSSTGGYFRARRWHRVTAVDANTFTTHRPFIADATGNYTTIVLLKNATTGATTAATSSWGRGYTLGGSNLMNPQKITFHEFVDYALVAVINAPTNQIEIASADDTPVCVRHGHDYPPDQPLGASAPTSGSWGLGARVTKSNRAAGTGSVVTGFSCGAAGTPGTWQSIQETLI